MQQQRDPHTRAAIIRTAMTLGVIAALVFVGFIVSRAL